MKAGRAMIIVFPTCVGMNPGAGLGIEEVNRVPHMRGDEPVHFAPFYPRPYVFPTCVGMNRGTADRIRS